VVGNGSVRSLGTIAEGRELDVQFLTDRDKAAYSALGLVHGMGGFKGLSMVSSGVRAWRRGHRQTRVQGDPLQQGGVFVIPRGGQAIFEHRSVTAGDHADIAAVLTAVGTLG
jgi:hypothetical protein